MKKIKLSSVTIDEAKLIVQSLEDRSRLMFDLSKRQKSKKATNSYIDRSIAIENLAKNISFDIQRSGVNKNEHN